MPKIHDLTVLLQRLLAIEPLWSALLPALLRLTDYGVDFRYPGNNATKTEARSALKDCRSIRQEARASLGL